MQTLGQLIDQLIIVKLKNIHADTDEKRSSTATQVGILSDEINGYLVAVSQGDIQAMTFPQNKVYSRVTEIIDPPNDFMDLGRLIGGLVESNVQMWKAQESVYNFREVPEDERVPVIDMCAGLNMHRNEYMDAIDRKFAEVFKRL